MATRPKRPLRTQLTQKQSERANATLAAIEAYKKDLGQGTGTVSASLFRKAFPIVLEGLANGQHLVTILEHLKIPWSSFHLHLNRSRKLMDEYARARKSGVEKMVSEIIPMADGVIKKEMSEITATRNAIDCRKWVAGKLMPKEYGDGPGAGLTINNQTNVLVMSDERLARLQETRLKMLRQENPPA